MNLSMRKRNGEVQDAGPEVRPAFSFFYRLRDLLKLASSGLKPDSSICAQLRAAGKKMIGRLNHVAIVVDNVEKASAVYRNALGAKVSAPESIAEHGVTVVFVELPNTKIELLEPYGENSPIAGFLAKNPSGGMHHVCYEVEDILAARDQLKASGARVIGDGDPRIGAHGKPVLFLHPKDFCGTLVELEQA